MRRPRISATMIAGGLAACTVLLGCTNTRETARVSVKDAGGTIVGHGTFSATDDGVRFRFAAERLPSGVHAIHIHENGTCTGPDFASAGDHLNPGGHGHGLEDDAHAHHLGDMPNLDVSEDGTVEYEYVIEGARLDGTKWSLLRSGGTAVVVHEGADDGRTDPSGGAGSRIACGVIEVQG